MKIATWNVNGIRAREAQLCEWLDRDSPDVVCLQELKAEPAQIPASCHLEDYYAFWHGMRAYSGVSIQIKKHLIDAAPEFAHPAFDMESRIVQVSIGNLIVASAQKTNEIMLPVAITVFPGELYQAPETWARRAYPNLTYFHEVDKGGHFAAWEQPQLFSHEMRAAFRSLRNSA